MGAFDKPNLVVSKCLGFEACRYDGKALPNDFVKKLSSYVNFITVCPEVEIGLGIPREPIRVLAQGEVLTLIQPATGKEYTEEMRRFSHSFLDSLEEVQGFILKGRSPSCGTRDVKAYLGIHKGASYVKSKGLFAQIVSETFPYAAIEEEGRLTNLRIREHFLTKLFTLTAFEVVKTLGSVEKLIEFHEKNRFLLMAYNQKELRSLENIIKEIGPSVSKERMQEYEMHLHCALTKMARYTSNLKVLYKGVDCFSKELSQREKEFIGGLLLDYQQGRIPLSVPVNVIKSWIIRFEREELMDQTFFSPYPKELMDCSDSGRRRNIE